MYEIINYMEFSIEDLIREIDCLNQELDELILLRDKELIHEWIYTKLEVSSVLQMKLSA